MKKWRLVLIPGVLLVAAGAFVMSRSYLVHKESGGVVPLVHAAPAGATFLEREAGIAAYFKAPSGITLAAAKSAYVILEKETPDYLIGWVSPRADVSEEFNTRVYVGADGWIVAYYPQGEATSKIVDWKTYSAGAFSTFIELALLKVASAAGVSARKVTYYHYGYPGANSLMVLVGAASEGDKEFSFTVPAGLSLSEVSWTVNGRPCNHSCRLSISGNTIVSCFYPDNNRYMFGRLEQVVPRDSPVKVRVTQYTGSERGGVVIVYAE